LAVKFTSAVDVELKGVGFKVTNESTGCVAPKGLLPIFAVGCHKKKIPISTIRGELSVAAEDQAGAVWLLYNMPAASS